MAIQALQISISKNLFAFTSVHIFSDSEFAIGALTNSTKVNKNNTINYAAINTIREFPKLFINFHWVPGHVAVEGNERADTLAELGSSNSASGSGLKHQLTRASQALFLPDDALSKLYQTRPPPLAGGPPLSHSSPLPNPLPYTFSDFGPQPYYRPFAIFAHPSSHRAILVLLAPASSYG